MYALWCFETETCSIQQYCHLLRLRNNGKGRAVLLQAWSGPEGSRKLRFPDF